MLRSSTTGQGLTGKVHSDFSGKYNIAGGAEVTLSFSSGTAGDAYSSGKICELGLGKYAWHVPNAVFASLGNVSAVLGVAGGIDVYCEWLVVAAVRDAAAFGANTTAPATPTNVTDARDAVLAKLPAALVGGRIDASVGAMAADTLTAAAISADAGAELAALVETYIVNEGDATAVLQAVADKIAQDWIAGDASPVAIATAVWATATRTITGGVLTTSPPTTAAIADAVWDESRSGHATAGTFGEKVTAELDSASITAVQSGLATASALADVQTDVDGANNYLSALSGVFTGITSLANWLRRGFRKDSGTAGMTTAETEINTGGTATFVGTTDSLEAIRDASGGSGGGTATLEKQEEILTAIQGSQVIQVPSPNVQGNLVLTQGDSYDGIANPKASWTVTTDYTDGWSVTLTIRDADDAVIYTTSGTVVSVTVIAVQIDAPTGLTMTGCPGQWQGKFDVELTKAGSKKTIALGVCYINEDQTR